MSLLNTKLWPLISGILVLFSGLNRYTAGLLQIEGVSAIYSRADMQARIAFTLLGLGALYDIILTKTIWSRWQDQFRKPALVYNLLAEGKLN